jgi:long-chain fatty acid transport protein
MSALAAIIAATTARRWPDGVAGSKSALYYAMPRPGPWAGAAALALVLAGSGAVRAQGVSLNRAGSGARAAGMGDAFVPVSDDGTAASWNPAGLAQLRQPEFSLVYAVSQRGLSLSALRSPDGRLGYTVDAPSGARSSSVDFASAAIPFSLVRRPTTLQVSWRRLYQLDNVVGGDFGRFALTQPDVRLGFLSVDDHLSGHIDVISLAGAVKLTARTAVGGSIDFWRGAWTERLAMAEEPDPQGRTAFFDSVQSARTRGHNATFGLLLTYPAWSAGIVYHLPFWSSFRAHQEAISTLGPMQVREVPNARWRLPRSIAGGLAWRMAPRWMVAAALTHDQWTDMLLAGVPDRPGAVNFFDDMPPELSSTRDTVSVNVGAEHLFVGGGAVVPLRVGLGWEPQGQRDRVTGDSVDYVLASAGTGYNTNRVKFDAAVQFRWAAYRAGNAFAVSTLAGGDPPYDTIGQARSHEWRIKVSAIYRIQDTEKLRSILRKVFG